MGICIVEVMSGGALTAYVTKLSSSLERTACNTRYRLSTGVVKKAGTSLGDKERNRTYAEPVEPTRTITSPKQRGKDRIGCRKNRSH